MKNLKHLSVLLEVVADNILVIQHVTTPNASQLLAVVVLLSLAFCVWWLYWCFETHIFVWTKRTNFGGIMHFLLLLFILRWIGTCGSYIWTQGGTLPVTCILVPASENRCGWVCFWPCPRCQHVRPGGFSTYIGNVLGPLHCVYDLNFHSIPKYKKIHLTFCWWEPVQCPFWYWPTQICHPCRTLKRNIIT